MLPAHQSRPGEAPKRESSSRIFRSPGRFYEMRSTARGTLPCVHIRDPQSPVRHAWTRSSYYDRAPTMSENAAALIALKSWLTNVNEEPVPQKPVLSPSSPPQHLIHILSNFVLRLFAKGYSLRNAFQVSILRRQASV